MGKPNDFDQFSGPGRAYAPKPPPAPRQSAQPFPPDQESHMSEEDDLRSDYYARGNRVQPPSNPHAQSTDHMN